jgi:PAS domain S-box-containing protein
VALNFFENEYFNKILNVINDGIYISDQKGNTLWLNKASEKILNKRKDEIIGRNVIDLEREGIMKPSVTRMVLENRNTITTVQTSSNGRKYLVTGHMITVSGEKLIVVHSRDITEAVRTSTQLGETEQLLKRYSEEIRLMKLRENKALTNQNLIGKSSIFRQLLKFIEKVAGVDTTVLITGETGVGKNVIAEQIHKLSSRHQKPFVHINCGAIPESLFESELFGYKKGAFTGALNSEKIGLVQMADGGTMFLDEISELPIHLQSKLLQLLQNKSYLPVGDTKVRTADIRIIAATNRDLLEMAKEGTFRLDLYYRLNVLPIHVPSVRERQEDIFPLLYHFLKKFNQMHSKNRRFSPELLDVLQNYEWPGNIREMENLIERLVITSKEDEISIEDLPEKMKKNRSQLKQFLKEGESLTEALERIEKNIILEAYQTYKTTRKTAEMLGVTQSLLMRRLKKYK